MKTQGEDGQLQAGERGLEPSLTVRPQREPSPDLDLRRPAPELGTNTFLSSKLFGLWCSISTALAN